MNYERISTRTALIGEEPILDTMRKNSNGHIRTSDGANPATNTTRLLSHLCVKISFRIDLTRHAQDLLRASAHAQLTAFAPIFFY
jgi:hypothetical protein